MSAKHIIPGFDDPTCGIAVAAKQLVARGVGEDGEVWVHSMWTPMVIKASIKALLTGKKLVRMPHGCTDPTKLRHHWHKKRWVAPIERWIFCHADRIIATCEEEAEWIREFEPWVKRVEIVRLGGRAGHAATDNSLAESHNAAENEEDVFRLLYVGRLHPLKGVEYLLEAMHQLQNSKATLRFARSLRLKLIGKDEGEGKKLRRMASKYNLNVEFRGIVSEEEKEAAYRWCDVLVLPTLSENFGLVIAEALERGKCVITTDGAPAWGDGNDYGGRLIYIKGYRDGSKRQRVDSLNNSLKEFLNNGVSEK